MFVKWSDRKEGNLEVAAQIRNLSWSLSRSPNVFHMTPDETRADLSHGSENDLLLGIVKNLLQKQYIY